jgi:hypothetical protein
VEGGRGNSPLPWGVCVITHGGAEPTVGGAALECGSLLPLFRSELARGQEPAHSRVRPASRPDQSGSKLPHSKAGSARKIRGCHTDPYAEGGLRWRFLQSVSRRTGEVRGSFPAELTTSHPSRSGPRSRCASSGRGQGEGVASLPPLAASCRPSTLCHSESGGY